MMVAEGPFYQHRESDLRAYLAAAGGTLPAAEACAIAAQVAGELAITHAHAGARGGLTPENIHIRTSTHPPTAMINGEPPGVAAGNAMPGYLAPELLAGDQASLASDIYALGVILAR